MTLAPGWYYKKYDTPLAEVPIGPFENEEKAIQAAGGRSAPDEAYYITLHVLFDNYGWGS